MVWKNQLTKTPILVLFVILISIGVGTAAALGTITLAGDVVITDSLTVDTDTLVVDAGNDRVGIGTSTPATKLHIVGDVTIGSRVFCDGCITAPELEQPSLRFLGPFGDPVGTGYSISCLPGHVAIGMDGRSEAAIDDVRLLCKKIVRPSIGQFIDPVFGDVTSGSSTVTGSGGGTPFSFTCPGTDQGQGVVVGMKFWQDTIGPDFTIEGIQLLCINVETGVLSSSPIFGSSTGFTLGTFNNCINNRMLAGLDGDHGESLFEGVDLVNSFRLICR